MDRRLAQRNLTSGLIVGGVALAVFALVFLAAIIYMR
jgi:hypothetical protein